MASGSINTIMTNALKTSWQLTDDFQFIYNNKSIAPDINSQLPWGDLLEICTISCDTPQVSADVQPYLIGGSYRIGSTKFQAFTFSVVFRDIKGMQLKNYFQKVWMAQQDSYFDEIKSHIKISISQNVMFESEDCLITSISQSQFDNGNTAAAEFTVEFMSPVMSSTYIKNFGAPGVTGRQK